MFSATWYQYIFKFRFQHVAGVDATVAYAHQLLLRWDLWSAEAGYISNTKKSFLVFQNLIAHFLQYVMVNAWLITSESLLCRFRCSLAVYFVVYNYTLLIKLEKIGYINTKLIEPSFYTSDKSLDLNLFLNTWMQPGLQIDRTLVH